MMIMPFLVNKQQLTADIVYCYTFRTTIETVSINQYTNQTELKN